MGADKGIPKIGTAALEAKAGGQIPWEERIR